MIRVLSLEVHTSKSVHVSQKYNEQSLDLFHSCDRARLVSPSVKLKQPCCVLNLWQIGHILINIDSLLIEACFVASIGEVPDEGP